jgi:hypothetical protein
MPTFPVTGLTLEMRASDDDQYYLYGVVVDGVFIRLWVTKTGGLNDDFERAAAEAAAAPTPTPAPTPAYTPPV